MHILLSPWSGGYLPGIGGISASSLGWTLATTDVLDLDIEEAAFVPPGVGNRSTTVHKEELLLCVGLATSPAVSHAQPSAWGFFVEHLASFRAGSGRVRAVADSKDWDPHVKTMFSDRVGMGAAVWALWRDYDVVHIADADRFIGRALAKAPAAFRSKWLKSLGKYGKTGKYKPDFFCLDSSGQVVVAEAKGAMGPPSVLASDIKKGKEQVRNVDPVGVALRPANNRLVLALNLRRANESPNKGKDSALRVVDPEGGDDPLAVQVSAEELVRAAYAKVCTFAGQPLLAAAILSSRSPLADEGALEQSSVVFAGRRAVPLAAFPGFFLGLDLGVAQALLASSSEDLPRRVHQATSGFGEYRRGLLGEGFDAGIALPNGVVASFQPEEVIFR